MLDVLADFACVRDWIGVNPAVEVTAGILLGIILVSSLHVLLKVRRPGGSLGVERLRSFTDSIQTCDARTINLNELIGNKGEG